VKKYRKGTGKGYAESVLRIREKRKSEKMKKRKSGSTD